MRAFLDSILSFILASSLSDDEWATISTLNDLSYTLTNYTALLGVLDARESVSEARDRLKFYFQAAGVVITDADTPPQGKSNLFIGDEL